MLSCFGKIGQESMGFNGKELEVSWTGGKKFPTVEQSASGSGGELFYRDMMAIYLNVEVQVVIDLQPFV